MREIQKSNEAHIGFREKRTSYDTLKQLIHIYTARCAHINDTHIQCAWLTVRSTSKFIQVRSFFCTVKKIGFKGKQDIEFQ